tara:strand:- start:6797 stop:7135 length:339 start_codon:yes stop_codon:yes gene_type:complete
MILTLLQQIPELPDLGNDGVVMLLRWIIGILIAFIVFSFYVVRLEFKAYEKKNDTEKERLISAVEKAQDELGKEITDNNASLIDTSEKYHVFTTLAIERLNAILQTIINNGK